MINLEHDINSEEGLKRLCFYSLFMKIIAQGAEAILTKEGNAIIKERVKKSYRIEEIDEKLRSSRTRKEAALLRAARRCGVSTPQIFEEEKTAIKMEFIDGKKVKDTLNKKNAEEIGKEIGENIALLHNNGIIHGDLTTSNMIINIKSENDARSAFQSVYFIDFGLGFSSSRIEDKAIDLRLLEQAIKSTHFEIYEVLWKSILNTYEKSSEDAKETIKRLSEIEKRARYKER